MGRGVVAEWAGLGWASGVGWGEWGGLGWAGWGGRVGGVGWGGVRLVSRRE